MISEVLSPKVSIITPSYNRADIIDETAESIFNQTYSNWEWVIVDDGSTDNSWEKLQQYQASDKRIKVFQRDRGPKGACTCRNIAVERCTGDYVLFLDTDDLLATFCLEQRVKTMQQDPDCDFVIFPMLLFKSKPDDLQMLWNIDKPVDDIERILMGDPVCQGTGTLWKKSSFIKIGMWDEDLLLWQDIELHLRSLLNSEIKFRKHLHLQPDVFLRVSDVSLSRTGYHSLPKWKSRRKVLVSTIEAILKRNLVKEYSHSLNGVFRDILLNAANSGYFDEAADLLKKDKEWQLVNDEDRAYLRKYIFFRKSKLYKISFLQKLFLGRTKEHTSEESLGKVRYTKTIQL